MARATQAASSADYSNAGTVRPAEWTVLVTAALGTMLAPLNSTMIVVALPVLLGEFHSSVTWEAWIVTSYLVAMAAIQPVGGSLGDRYGRQRLFLVGLGLFLAATGGSSLLERRGAADLPHLPSTRRRRGHPERDGIGPIVSAG